MSVQFNRMEKVKNNRCRLLQIVYTQKKKAPQQNMNFQIKVQNMIKQIQATQNERSRCQSGYDNKIPQISRLMPTQRISSIDPLNLKFNKIRSTSRQTNLIIDRTNKKYEQKNNSLATLDTNFRLSSSPLRYNNKNKASIQTLMFKDTITLKEQSIQTDQRTQALENIFQNISSWSRKSSESIF